MTLWLDAQLSPGVARWLTETFGVTVLAVRDVGLREAEDEEIFFAARKAADVMIKGTNEFSKISEAVVKAT